MSDHKTELIDAAVSLIEDAIKKFSGNKAVDESKRGMFTVTTHPGGSGDITSISLAIKLPRIERPKHFALNVACDNNVMLLLKINYFVLHAIALISMATRGEPVDAFVDQFNDYNAEKESDEVSGRYCGSLSGGGDPKKKKKTNTTTKKKTVKAAAAAIPKDEKKNKKTTKKNAIARG